MLSTSIYRYYQISIRCSKYRRILQLKHSWESWLTPMKTYFTLTSEAYNFLQKKKNGHLVLWCLGKSFRNQTNSAAYLQHYSACFAGYSVNCDRLAMFFDKFWHTPVFNWLKPSSMPDIIFILSSPSLWKPFKYIRMHVLFRHLLSSLC